MQELASPFDVVNGLPSNGIAEEDFDAGASFITAALGGF